MRYPVGGVRAGECAGFLVDEARRLMDLGLAVPAPEPTSEHPDPEIDQRMPQERAADEAAEQARADEAAQMSLAVPGDDEPVAESRAGEEQS